MTDGERLNILCTQVMKEELSKQISDSFDNLIGATNAGIKVSTGLLSFDDFVIYATSDDQWAIKKRYSGIKWDDNTLPEIAEKTKEIMMMWSNIEASISNLTPIARQNLIQQFPAKSIRFEGYDKNMYPISRKYIHNTNLWLNVADEFQIFKERDLENNVGQSVYAYLQALDFYQQTGLDEVNKLSNLTYNEIQTLLNLMN